VVELLALLEINRVFVTVAAAITTTATATAMNLLLGVRGVELNWQCQALGSYRDATASQCVYYNNYLLTGFRDYFICKRIRTVQSVWPVPPIRSHGTNPNARYKACAATMFGSVSR